MKQMLMGAAMLLGLAAPAAAQEVWIEQYGAGTASTCLGEQGIARFKPVAFTAGRKQAVARVHHVTTITHVHE